jgi:hypothetical protein
VCTLTRSTTASRDWHHDVLKVEFLEFQLDTECGVAFDDVNVVGRASSVRLGVQLAQLFDTFITRHLGDVDEVESGTVVEHCALLDFRSARGHDNDALFAEKFASLRDRNAEIATTVGNQQFLWNSTDKIIG